MSVLGPRLPTRRAPVHGSYSTNTGKVILALSISAHDPVRTMVGMAFVRILARHHTDGGTGATRMGMEDKRHDPVRAAQHRACTVPRRRPSMIEGTCDARFSQAGRDALGLARLGFLDDPGGRTYGGGSCPSYRSMMRSYFTPA